MCCGNPARTGDGESYLMVLTPIYDDNPFTQPVKPVVSWGLIATNLALFVYEAAAPQAGFERMIDTFSLDDFVDDLTSNYSHGMRQRTVFAAALLALASWRLRRVLVSGG